MATSFPGGIDTFTNPASTDSLDSAVVPHATQHANVNDAVEAVETLLGVNGTNVVKKADNPALLANSPSAGAAAIVEVGGGRPDAGVAHVDLHAVNGTDFDARLIRYGDTNGNLALVNTGTGALVFTLNGSDRFIIDANGGVSAGSGTSFGPWTTYVPVLGNWSQNGSSGTGAYCQIGKIVIFRAYYGFTGAPTVSGIPTISLPVIAKSATGQVTGLFLDSGSTTYMAFPSVESTGSVSMYAFGANGVRTNPTDTVPFTFAANDALYVWGVYEAA